MTSSVDGLSTPLELGAYLKGGSNSRTSKRKNTNNGVDNGKIGICSSNRD
jgi:hypothetical protein